MDVVGGVIVAAQTGKRGMKRGAAGASSTCAGEYGAWEWSRGVSPRRDGGDELRSVLGGGGLVSSPSPSSSLGLADHPHGGALLPPFFRPASSTVPMFTKPTPAVRSWEDPVQYLLRKELTVTDVGELGRIILPKRDAELHLPHLDNKEGRLLKMEDYYSNKAWTLRYKWWPNNKSRMYVLESTGDFVKYYDLKEKDELLLYKDSAGRFIIRGQKWSPPNALLRADTFPFKGKSTAKRSPRVPTPRITASTSNAAASNGTAAVSNGSAAHAPKAHASPYLAKALDASASSEGANCHLQLGLTTHHNSALVNHTSKMLHPLDCGLLTVGASILSTSVLSTSLLTTSVLSHSSVEQSEIGVALDGYCAHPDGVIDWEKLPDPPAIEFCDPPVIEFPGEFECTWGDCI